MSKIEAVAPNSGTTKENSRELTADELDAVAGGTRTRSVINSSALTLPKPAYPPTA